MSIKVTSPVSHMVSSAARGVIQTIVGVRLFGDIITGLVARLPPLSGSSAG